MNEIVGNLYPLQRGSQRLCVKHIATAGDAHGPETRLQVLRVSAQAANLESGLFELRQQAAPDIA